MTPTQQEQDGEQLRQCEARFRELFNHMNSGAAIYSVVDEGKDFLFENINVAAENMDRISKDAVIGKRLTQVFPNIRDFGLVTVLQRVWETGKPEHLPAALYRDNRIEGWRENYVFKLPSGEVVAVYDDVTQRKQADEKLEKSEERLRLMVEHLPSGAVYREGNAILLNKAAEDITGYSRAELSTVDEWFEQLYGGEHTQRRKLYEESRTAGFPVKRSLFITRKDGNKRCIDFTAYTYEEGEVWLLHDVTDQKQAKEALLEYQKQLRSLASELSLAEDRERKRIAMELHDGLGQVLSMVHVKLEMLRESPEAIDVEDVEAIRKLVDQAIDDTHSLTFELSSPVLHQMGLVHALEQLRKDMGMQYGLTITIEADEWPEPPNSELRMVLFRSVRELLINVAKHAGAERVAVRLTCNEGWYFIRVEDDGMGFDTTEIGKSLSPSGGFGLFSMHEYLRHMGGALEIQSTPGHGTQVQINVPLKAGGTVGLSTGEPENVD